MKTCNKARPLAVLLAVLLPALAAPEVGAQNSLTNGLVTYLPMDTIVGSVTPDLVSGYDFTLVNLVQTNLVPGRPGASNAFAFFAAQNTILRHVGGATDLLPINKNPKFTVSIWVNVQGATTDPITLLPATNSYGMPASPNDRRIYSESDFNGNNNPLWVIGTQNGGQFAHWLVRQTSGSAAPYTFADGTLQLPNIQYVQGNNRTSSNAFDGQWHHLVTTMDTNGNYAVYVDGVLDPGPGINLDGYGNPTVVQPLPTTNTFFTNTFVPWKWEIKATAIGGLARNATPAVPITGVADDLALWTRDLTPTEVAQLYSNGIPVSLLSTNPPLRINSFTADYQEVAQNGQVALRWDTAGATTLSIDKGVGDVLPFTVSGVGSTFVTVTSNTTFTLTAGNGVLTKTAPASVTAFPGVAPGWHLLARFDSLANTTAGIQAPNWVNALGDFSGALDRFNVITVSNATGTNKVLAARTGYLPNATPPPDFTPRGALAGEILNSLTIKEGSSNTLFFRLYVTEAGCAPFTFRVGLTEAPLLGPATYGGGAVGPAVIITRASATDPVDFQARNGVGNALGGGSFLTTDPAGIQRDQIYNVWMDIQNNPISFVPDGGGGTNQFGDIFSVYLQRVGEASRTLVFSNFYSDRDYINPDVGLGPPGPNLTTLFVTVANTFDGTNIVMLDDFYLTTNGFDSGLPIAPAAYPDTQPDSLRILVSDPVYLRSDPNNANNPSFTLTWSETGCGTGAGSYSVLRKDSLSAASWTTVASGLPSGGATTSYTDTSPPAGASAFYRITSP